jgi:hypothetical protein
LTLDPASVGLDAVAGATPVVSVAAVDDVVVAADVALGVDAVAAEAEGVVAALAEAMPASASISARYRRDWRGLSQPGLSLDGADAGDGTADAAGAAAGAADVDPVWKRNTAKDKVLIDMTFSGLASLGFDASSASAASVLRALWLRTVYAGQSPACS